MAESNSKKNDHRSVLKIGPIVIFGWPLPIAHKKKRTETSTLCL